MERAEMKGCGGKLLWLCDAVGGRGWAAKLLFAFLFAFMLLLEVCETAFAGEVRTDVYYIDHTEDGMEKIITLSNNFYDPSATYKKIDNQSILDGNVLASGNYVVAASCNIFDLFIEAEVDQQEQLTPCVVNLILMDDARLVVQNGIHVGEGATLNIYVGSESTSIKGNGVLYAGYTIPKSTTDDLPVRTCLLEPISTQFEAAGIGAYRKLMKCPTSLYYTGFTHENTNRPVPSAEDSFHACGTINIHGGVIYASGGPGAAGIGGISCYSNKIGYGLQYKYKNRDDTEYIEETYTITDNSDRLAEIINNLNCHDGGRVTIYGGTVTAIGTNGAAGIGGGADGSGNELTVYGGTVNAYGSRDERFVFEQVETIFSSGGAGIGSGKSESCTIDGGKLTVKEGFVFAEGNGGGAGIGGGNGGDGGEVDVIKGVVEATGDAGGAGIGGGNEAGSGGTVTIRDGSVSAKGGIKNTSGEDTGGGPGIGGTSASVTVYGGIVKAVGASGRGIEAKENGWNTGTDVQVWQNNEDVKPNGTISEKPTQQYVWAEKHGTVYYTEYMAGAKDTARSKTVLLNSADYSLIGYSSGSVTWDGTGAGGAVYVMENDTAARGSILVKGNVTLILLDGKTLYAQAGIRLESGARLNICAGSDSETIHGTGTLNASGGIIDNRSSGGTDAVKGDAGIGGPGTVIINGGYVNAVGGGFIHPASQPGGGGTGIGGIAGDGIGGVGCKVIINGGSVNATGGKGNDSLDSAPVLIGGGAGIGGDDSSVIINGGIVTAYGSSGGAGIGGEGGIDDPTVSVTINGGCVKAYGGSGITGNSGIGDEQISYNPMGGGAGIGSGAASGQSDHYNNQNHVTVTINGGCVTAVGGYEKQTGSGAGIGGGSYKAGGAVTVNGGKVMATGGGSEGNNSVSGIGRGFGVDVASGDGVTSLSLGRGVKLCGKEKNNSNVTQEIISTADTTVSWDRFPHYMWTDAGRGYYINQHATEADDGISSVPEYNILKGNDEDTLVLSSAWCNDWKTATYAVTGNVTVSKRVEVIGNLKLVICDGATLTAVEGIHVPEGSSLTVYAGSMDSDIADTGVLIADASAVDQAAGIGGNGGNGGPVTIHGCNVIASGGDGAAGIGTADAPVQITSGSVKALGGKDAYGIEACTMKAGNHLVFKANDDGKGWEEKEIPASSIITDRFRNMAFCTHQLTYSLSEDGATVTAVCNRAACFFEKQKATLTISVPLHTAYGDGKSPDAVITDEDELQGSATVVYYAADDDGNQTGGALGSAPTAVGKYRAELTVGNENQTVTAFKAYVIEKADIVLTDQQKPKGRELVYNASPQELVTAGEPITGGFLCYALGDADGPIQAYTISIPTGIDAGIYYVWYKVVGNPGYSGIDPACIPVTIAEAKSSYSYVSGAQGIWQKESGGNLSFRIKSSGNDGETFNKFTGIQVDGKPVDKSKYEAKQGSVIINLKPTYLETLSIGEHKLKVVFDDGNAETSFTIIRAETSAGNLPQTGDAQNPLLYAVIALISVAGIGLFRKRMK